MFYSIFDPSTLSRIIGINCDNNRRIFLPVESSLKKNAYIDILMIATHIPMNWRQTVFSNRFLR